MKEQRPPPPPWVGEVWYDSTQAGRGDVRPPAVKADPRHNPARRDPATVAGLGYTDREIRVTPWEWISEADKAAHGARKRGFERDVRASARTPFNPDWRAAHGVDAGNGYHTRRPAPCQPGLTRGVPRRQPGEERPALRRAALAWEE